MDDAFVVEYIVSEFGVHLKARVKYWVDLRSSLCM